MSKDLPVTNTPSKKNGLKKLDHNKVAFSENGVNFLNSSVVSHLHAYHADGPSKSSSKPTDDYVSLLNNNLNTCTRLLNGVHVSIGCSDVLKIHRCSSDGKLTDHVHVDEVNECSLSRSMSSSDSCMNGSHYLGNTDEVGEMSGAANKCNGTSPNNANQNDENNGKNNVCSKSQKGRANLPSKFVSLNEGVSMVVRDNDVVRPKTWSRKVAEKSKLKKEMVVKESTGNNTQTKRDEKVNEDTRTCKVFEHDRHLVHQQTSGLVNGNAVAQCSVLEINPPVNEGRLISQPNTTVVTNGESRPVNGELASDQCANGIAIDSCACDDLADIPALVVAPLAEPEDMSDDEIGACYSSSTGTDSARSNCENKTYVDQLENELNEISTDCMPLECQIKLDANMENKPDHVTFVNVSRNDASKNFAVYPESIFSRAPDEDDSSVSYGYSSPLSNTVSGASVGGDTVTMLDKHSPHRIDAMNEQIPNLQQVSSASIDSLEEIGDYIETDLPPNRLAFFSRGSSSSTTTEEDEGCGDEVLPNNDEESDNETIDPLNSYHNPGLPNLPDVQYNNQPLSFSMNVNSDMCQNPSFRSENWGQNFLGNTLICAKHVKSAQSCDTSSHCDDKGDAFRERNHRPDNGSQASNKISDSSHVNDFRYNNAQQKEADQTFELPDTNLGNPVEINSNGESNIDREKIENLDETVRHSTGSSESEATGMLYLVSDDSENTSPEFESGMEYVFPSVSGSASFSGGPVGMSSHQQGNVVFGDPSLNPRNHSASLDYDREEELLQCQYFVRRARSLDQEIDRRSRPQNRLSDLDIPNIQVANSNLQHDESNRNQKVFEKSAFEVMAPLPTWDSSDEEENNMVPGPDSVDEEPLDQILESMEKQLNRQTDSSNQLSAEFVASNISMPDDEPIYEEIDDLLVLMDEICSEGEPDNLQPVCNAISKLRRKRRHRSPVSDVEKVMIWNEYEAYVVQVKQIGTSACGPTAVLNVLKAFDFQVEKEGVCQTIASNMRMEAAPIPYYLFSRSTAGTTAQALVEGVASVTRGAIKGRFFHFYPQRDVEILKWLGHWMKKGAVPVATLNLQRGVKPGWTIPDAWHHQMVYGVSGKGVYLTNPLEIVPENVIMEQLTSDSVLLVRRHDVVSRFRDWCPLNEILKQRDSRWRTMNVIGQVVHMLRETLVTQEQVLGVRALTTSHISIPAVYKAGIILFMRANTETYEELLNAPELSIKNKDNVQPS